MTAAMATDQSPAPPVLAAGRRRVYRVRELPYISAGALAVETLMLAIALLPPLPPGIEAPFSPGEIAFLSGGWLCVLAATVLTVRCARSGTIIADEAGMVIRRLIRTRRYAWSQVESVRVTEGPVGRLGIRRAFLEVHWASGRRLDIRETGVLRRSRRRPRLERMAVELTAMARAHGSRPAAEATPRA
jgi:hypothetical protein